MISGLCGFAERVRQHGGDVGAAELIDAARAFTLIDLADRKAIEGALRLTISWASLQPKAFQELFDSWFAADGFEVSVAEDEVPEALFGVALDAETIDAARIHTDDALALEDRPDSVDEATADDGVRGSNPARAAGDDSGAPTTGHEGDLAGAVPSDDLGASSRQRDDVVVSLPTAPPGTELELARSAMSAALAARRSGRVLAAPSTTVTAVTAPLKPAEQVAITSCVRRLKRELSGAPSWRRRPARTGAVDLRRALRRTVTAGGLPIDISYLGYRHDAARLVVLVDLSLSVRGTSRLVLHLLHRLRSSVGSLRTFGFVDTFVPIDRALRTDDAVRAIENVLGSVDLNASSDPGRALRAWWSRWHQIITPETHVVILSDGRCNGNDPGYEIVRKIAARGAATTWISPEPPGAWGLGRGEMAEYVRCVDEAIAVRRLDDLERITVRSGRVGTRSA